MFHAKQLKYPGPKLGEKKKKKNKKTLSSRLKEAIVLSKSQVSLKHKHYIYPSC